ncbi:MAG TPA: efflux RND transporter periplasmic adaptor subunit [Roseiarcus sp.]|jgi:cobalt-zinc-cadmium efflux system membrane fusion protein|nr:efflux RND transporter periplasmic adaptor subunit [Roseiarcus sp.]
MIDTVAHPVRQAGKIGGSPPSEVTPGRRIEIGFGWRSIVVVCAALGIAGWWYGGALRPYLEPALAATGLGTQTATETPDAPAPEAVPADGSTVKLNVEGQQRLGLAFGKAEIRKIIVPVRVPGSVAFDERRVAHLKPRAQGRVLSLSVQPGDRVTAGETLATIDAAGVLDARNGLAVAQASLGEAQATAAVAELNLKRGADLVKSNAVSQAEVDRRQVDLAKAQASVKSAQAQVEMYRAQYDRLAPAPGAAVGTSAIVSPIAGVVTRADITLGDVVDTSRDAFTVADPSQILVLANLYGNDISGVEAGDHATVDAPIADHPRFEGRVRSINPAVDPASNTAPARIEIANPGDLLRANMFVSVEIAADLGREGVTIPALAVQQTEAGPIAFVRTADDRFERRNLTLGVQRADWVEVKAGISAGETVATQGSFGLKAILLGSLLGSTD